MIIEQIIFTVAALMMFAYLFVKMMKTSDISYIIFLVLDAIAIIINVIEVIFDIKSNMLINVVKYLFGIVFPLIIIIMEYKGKKLPETFNIILAKFYLKIGNKKRAKKLLIELADKYPENYNAHKLLAEIYEQEGGMRKAIDEYVLAVDINKKDYDSYYKVAFLLTNLDKKDEASQMLNNLLNIKPDYYQASQLLGDLLIENEMYKEAANVYQEALKYNPMSFDINYNLGIVYTMLNDFQNAKICYERAAQINSLSYNSKYSLAEIALIYKDLEEAEKRFLEVIDDEELSADAYIELSKIYLIKGDKDTAIKYANIAIDIDPKKIVNKVKKDSLFIPVIAKLSIPFNLESRIEELEEINKNKNIKKLGEKEIKSKQHLEEMFEITRHLGYNDIIALKSSTTIRKDKEIKIEEKIDLEDEKERHD